MKLESFKMREMIQPQAKDECLEPPWKITSMGSSLVATDNAHSSRHT